MLMANPLSDASNGMEQPYVGGFFDDALLLGMEAEMLGTAAPRTAEPRPARAEEAARREEELRRREEEEDELKRKLERERREEEEAKKQQQDEAASEDNSDAEEPEATEDGSAEPTAESGRGALRCASPGCLYRVHSRPEMGAYCCIACFQTRSGEHGPRCERVPATASSRRAEAAQAPMNGEQLAGLELEAARQAFKLEAEANAGDGAERELMMGGALSTGRFVEVPLDHVAPAGAPSLRVFFREVVLAAHAPEERGRLPVLFYMPDGPGLAAPRAIDAHKGWMGHALKDHRVVLMDPRGTGRSARINCRTLTGMSEREQAAHLVHFRADAIAEDCEAVRRTLGVNRLCVLGDRFGGYCGLVYASRYPARIQALYITGGFQPVLDGDDGFRRRLCLRLLAQSYRYYARFPSDVDKVREIVRHLDANGGVSLPGGGRLTSRRFLALGKLLSRGQGFDALHALLDGAFAPGAGEQRELDFSFLAQVEDLQDFDANPLRWLLQEVAYCSGPGSATRWSAAQALAEADFRKAFDHRAALRGPGAPIIFTGDAYFPGFADDFVALKSLTGVAGLLTAKTHWPRMFDPQQLRCASLPIAVVADPDDLNVATDLSKKAATSLGRECKFWGSLGFRQFGLDGEVLDGLLRMLAEPCWENRLEMIEGPSCCDPAQSSIGQWLQEVQWEEVYQHLGSDIGWENAYGEHLQRTQGGAEEELLRGGALCAGRRLAVPLDHDAAGGPCLELFYRDIVLLENVQRREELPVLLALLGGPGLPAPRPNAADGWLGRALREFRVLLPDVRGTGRSAKVTAKALAELGPERQAARLARFRLDAAARDWEALRRSLGAGRVSVFADGFGGCQALAFVSRYPDSVDAVYLACGLPMVMVNDPALSLAVVECLEKTKADTLDEVVPVAAEVVECADKVLGMVRDTLPDAAAMLEAAAKENLTVVLQGGAEALPEAVEKERLETSLEDVPQEVSEACLEVPSAMEDASTVFGSSSSAGPGDESSSHEEAVASRDTSQSMGAAALVPPEAGVDSQQPQEEPEASPATTGATEPPGAVPDAEPQVLPEAMAATELEGLQAPEAATQVGEGDPPESGPEEPEAVPITATPIESPRAMPQPTLEASVVETQQPLEAVPQVRAEVAPEAAPTERLDAQLGAVLGEVSEEKPAVSAAVEGASALSEGVTAGDGGEPSSCEELPVTGGTLQTATAAALEAGAEPQPLAEPEAAPAAVEDSSSGLCNEAGGGQEEPPATGSTSQTPTASVMEPRPQAETEAPPVAVEDSSSGLPGTAGSRQEEPPGSTSQTATASAVEPRPQAETVVPPVAVEDSGSGSQGAAGPRQEESPAAGGTSLRASASAVEPRSQAETEAPPAAVEDPGAGSQGPAGSRQKEPLATGDASQIATASTPEAQAEPRPKAEREATPEAPPAAVEGCASGLKGRPSDAMKATLLKAKMMKLLAQTEAGAERDKSLEYYLRYPDDVAKVREVVAHLHQHGGVRLPRGGTLTASSFLAQQQALAAEDEDSMHALLEQAFTEGDGERELEFHFLKRIQSFQSYELHPLFWLFEAMYCGSSGEGTVKDILEGDSNFPWWFDLKAALDDPKNPPLPFVPALACLWSARDSATLRPLMEAAELLSHRDDWPPLYDPAVLRDTQVPVVMCIRKEEPAEVMASQGVAAVLGERCEVWMSEGARDPESVLDRLLELGAAKGAAKTLPARTTAKGAAKTLPARTSIRSAASATEAPVRWRVVGGNKTGLLVRQGSGLRTPELGRLEAGSVVEEVERAGNRLRYRLVNGMGPASGWVNISGAATGRALMRRVA